MDGWAALILCQGGRSVWQTARHAPSGWLLEPPRTWDNGAGKRILRKGSAEQTTHDSALTSAFIAVMYATRKSFCPWERCLPRVVAGTEKGFR